MIVDLPKNLRGKNYEYIIKGGILYFSNPSMLKSIMRDITYTLKGHRRCFYCGKSLLKDNINIDHLYPKRFGGPPITNNLVPSCYECNAVKRSLTPEQFEEYSKLQDKEERLHYLSKAKEENISFRMAGLFQIPESWIDWIALAKIRFPSYKISEKKLETKKMVYNRFHNITEPIVIDCNNQVLDEFYWALTAQFFHLEKIPVVKLENVELISKKLLRDYLSE